MLSFSRCIDLLKASQYANLGAAIRYWWIADQSAFQDWYFRPARNYFNFENIKKSHWARNREYGRWGKTVTFSFFKKAVTVSEVWAGTLPCRIRICLKPVTGHRFWYYVLGFSSTMSLWYIPVMFFALFHRYFYCDSFTGEEKAY